MTTPDTLCTRLRDAALALTLVTLGGAVAGLLLAVERLGRER
jgi:hypothetical protein